FPQAEIDRQRASRLASLVQQRQDPSTVAAIVALLGLYGPAHPYGYIEMGNEQAVQSTTRDDLDGFWKRAFVPGNAALVVAGAVGESELRPLVEKTFGSWSGSVPAPPTIGPGQTTTARVLVVDKPQSPQTYLMVATIGGPRSAPDYAAANVMNMVLG